MQKPSIASLSEDIHRLIFNYVTGTVNSKNYALVSKSFAKRFNRYRWDRLTRLLPIKAAQLFIRLCLRDRQLLEGANLHEIIRSLHNYLLNGHVSIQENALAATALMLLYIRVPSFPKEEKIPYLPEKLLHLLKHLANDDRTLVQGLHGLLAMATADFQAVDRIEAGRSLTPSRRQPNASHLEFLQFWPSRSIELCYLEEFEIFIKWLIPNLNQEAISAKIDVNFEALLAKSELFDGWVAPVLLALSSRLKPEQLKRAVATIFSLPTESPDEKSSLLKEMIPYLHPHQIITLLTIRAGLHLQVVEKEELLKTTMKFLTAQNLKAVYGTCRSSIQREYEFLKVLYSTYLAAGNKALAETFYAEIKGDSEYLSWNAILLLEWSELVNNFLGAHTRAKVDLAAGHMTECWLEILVLVIYLRQIGPDVLIPFFIKHFDLLVGDLHDSPLTNLWPLVCTWQSKDILTIINFCVEQNRDCYFISDLLLHLSPQQANEIRSLLQPDEENPKKYEYLKQVLEFLVVISSWKSSTDKQKEECFHIMSDVLPLTSLLLKRVFPALDHGSQLRLLQSWLDTRTYIHSFSDVAGEKLKHSDFIHVLKKHYLKLLSQSSDMALDFSEAIAPYLDPDTAQELFALNSGKIVRNGTLLLRANLITATDPLVTSLKSSTPKKTFLEALEEEYDKAETVTRCYCYQADTIRDFICLLRDLQEAKGKQLLSVNECKELRSLIWHYMDLYFALPIKITIAEKERIISSLKWCQSIPASFFSNKKIAFTNKLISAIQSADTIKDVHIFLEEALEEYSLDKESAGLQRALSLASQQLSDLLEEKTVMGPRP